MCRKDDPYLGKYAVKDTKFIYEENLPIWAARHILVSHREVVPTPPPTPWGSTR